MAVQVVVGVVLMPVFAALVQPILASAGPEGLRPLFLIFSLVGTALYFVTIIPLIALGVAVLCYTFKALARYAPDDIFLPPDG